ncbi:MAG: NAD-dependent epimerase/dehydratase family protein [Gemmatimonadetes bacterium]|nr:NAD-dependent epimerase/dehydratase family protein [Gemmatimonadota bacterium]
MPWTPTAHLMTSRRGFLTRATAAAGGALLLGRDILADVTSHTPDPRARAPMRLLVLGGTGFIGPHLVRHAVGRGHHVTIFTRGRHEADLPEGVVRRIGDRNGQLQALEGKTWDAVIDDSATDPEWVRMSTGLLKGAVGRYLFTSSTGVFYPYLRRGLAETDPVRLEITDPQDGSESFGVRKAQCERVTLDAFGDEGFVVRPTYIVGPGDTTDRFPYWPVRLAQGGETLAPGHRDDPVQVIDVRDLATFMVKLLEDGPGGVYNVAGPKETLTIAGFLEVAIRALGSSSTLTWVDDYDFLAEHGIHGSIPWVMLRGNDLGHTSIANAKAIGAGLSFRALDGTVRDTLAWWATVPAERRDKPRFAITPELEARALADWKQRGR